MRLVVILLLLFTQTHIASAQLVDTAWVRTFPAEAGNQAQLTGMELDSLGNPIVIGWKSTPATHNDFLILKYFANGDTAWARTYDFPEHGDDQATALSILAVPHTIAVSGACSGEAVDGQYAATVLLTAEGEVIDTLIHPMAAAMANLLLFYQSANDWLELFVVGRSGEPSGDLTTEHRTTVLGMANEIHEYANFVPLFAAPGPDDQTLFIGGWSGSAVSWLYATAAVALDGTDSDTNWVRREQESAVATRMMPCALASTANGGVVVTGEYRSMSWTQSPDEMHWVTYRYDDSGNKLWTAEYVTCSGEARALIADVFGNTIVAGSAKPNYACNLYLPDTTEILVLKYDADGDLDWDIRYSAPDVVVHDVVAGVADATGNIYVAANLLADPSDEDYDVLVLKLNPDGEEVWTYTYSSADGGSDLASTLKIDQTGNLFLGATTNEDELVVIKLVQITATAVEDDISSALPKQFQLLQNFPNPFNPATEISFSLSVAADVQLEIFNLNGQLVRRLVDEFLPAGQHRATWDGKDQAGRGVASGVYFYRFKAADYAESRKMILLR